ncbi:MAG: AarF/ABC1/UbiB kinase family protein [Candidatus Obscuribacterales bacterium]|nr:AarF/ABC1/UbiB kinase family protein [Candidatus Obscuribacterales bacterium]
MKSKSEKMDFNPVHETFRDVSAWKLVKSVWRVFWRIYEQQGFAGAFRVIPIVWTIIFAVRGFARYHSLEFQRLAEASGKEIDEVELTDKQTEEYKRLGAWLRTQLHGLGPTFIKIGQTLSTRADLLPLPAMLELTKLQEEVEPAPYDVAEATIVNDLGGKPETLYAKFDKTPLAAASLSQAYLAELHDGRQVVVKVQRPGLPELLKNDVQALTVISEEVMKYPSLARHTDWPGTVKEFARTVFEEIDYIAEGRNADCFRHNHRLNERIYIPRIIWRLTGKRVLTIEYVPGVRATDVEAIEKLGIDRREITVIGANFYLKQLLEDGFFHADPHPGNMRAMADGRIGIFDFGMVGRVSPELKRSMVQALLHVIDRDYLGLVDDFVDMKFLPPDVDRLALCREITPIVEARFAEGLNKVRFRKLLLDFSDLVWRYPFRLPSEFTFIMRALLTLEGVALTINPDFNFIDASLPFAQRMVLRNSGAAIGQVIMKEVFPDGRFNPQAALNLFRTAAKLSMLSSGSGF